MAAITIIGLTAWAGTAKQLPANLLPLTFYFLIVCLVVSVRWSRLMAPWLIMPTFFQDSRSTG